MWSLTGTPTGSAPKCSGLKDMTWNGDRMLTLAFSAMPPPKFVKITNNLTS